MCTLSFNTLPGLALSDICSHFVGPKPLQGVRGESYLATVVGRSRLGVRRSAQEPMPVGLCVTMILPPTRWDAMTAVAPCSPMQHRCSQEMQLHTHPGACHAYSASQNAMTVPACPLDHDSTQAHGPFATRHLSSRR